MSSLVGPSFSEVNKGKHVKTENAINNLIASYSYVISPTQMLFKLVQNFLFIRVFVGDGYSLYV